MIQPIFQTFTFNFSNLLKQIYESLIDFLIFFGFMKSLVKRDLLQFISHQVFFLKKTENSIRFKFFVKKK